ncbi:PREDICTED: MITOFERRINLIKE 1 chloroplastic [Prunus dulcis]|uniref:PREDICTED: MITOFERRINLIKE 1 chloroplastic n=1 Tax=Prunus dulcis TaxID=3755 RepID=A0A5E4FNP1_PRUDU|nr:PREDICTED: MITOFERRINLIKE 1 chloroplastic [Prunus dulcis]
MENRLSASLGLPSPNQDTTTSIPKTPMTSIASSPISHPKFPIYPTQNHIPFFASTTSTTTSPPQIGIAGAFTYFCLHPLDTIKTKLQTRGASDIYANTFDAVLKTFQIKGISGFYNGIGSTAIYFGTCELGKSVLSKLPN